MSVQVLMEKDLLFLVQVQVVVVVVVAVSRSDPQSSLPLAVPLVLGVALQSDQRSAQW